MAAPVIDYEHPITFTAACNDGPTPHCGWPVRICGMRMVVAAATTGSGYVVTDLKSGRAITRHLPSPERAAAEADKILRVVAQERGTTPAAVLKRARQRAARA